MSTYHFHGESAFPSRAWGPDEKGFEGMSLRDYFAATAMAGMFASDDKDWHCKNENYPIRAASAYLMADAMLREKYK